MLNFQLTSATGNIILQDASILLDQGTVSGTTTVSSLTATNLAYSNAATRHAISIQGDTAAENLAAQLEVEYRGCTINTFGGGVNEIQREIVSMLGLRMPRVSR